MVRMKRAAGQWGLLAAGLLAGGVLVLHEISPEVSKPATPTYGAPVYTLAQVLAGWERQPGRWVGKTILIRSANYSACEAANNPVKGMSPVPCIADPGGGPATVLYDEHTGLEIPTAASPGKSLNVEQPVAISWTGDKNPNLTNDATHIWRVRLTIREHCGPLGQGRQPCLLAIDPTWVAP